MNRYEDKRIDSVKDNHYQSELFDEDNTRIGCHMHGNIDKTIYSFGYGIYNHLKGELDIHTLIEVDGIEINITTYHISRNYYDPLILDWFSKLFMYWKPETYLTKRRYVAKLISII